MKCDQKMFELLKEYFGPDCYDSGAKLEWDGFQPMLTFKGEKHPVDKATWFNIATTSGMTCDCISCLPSDPLEVIALKLSDPTMFGLVAFNKQKFHGNEMCGYHYAPAIVEALKSRT